MRITYMALAGETMLQYHCSKEAAKAICATEAMEDLTWEEKRPGFHTASDSFGNKYSVVLYQRH